MTGLGWYREVAGATVVAVRLTPRADRDRVEGVAELADGSAVLKVRVRAVPEDGAANAALERLMAKTLGVPKSSVSVVAGKTQRIKQVRIGRPVRELSERLDALGASLPAGH